MNWTFKSGWVVVMVVVVVVVVVGDGRVTVNVLNFKKEDCD